MSERKVLNKYYPPDFDPSRIPRLRLPKNRQYTVRLMSPCNMRCNTCGDYIAKGKKFNARKETVETETYLGLKVFRFYFKCPRCMAEITFKTDPKSMDYEVEHGATPNFKALKLAEQQAEQEAKDKEEEEKLNPMKLLENRTKASRREMENIEALEDLKEMSQRQRSIDYEDIIKSKIKEEEEEAKRQEEEDEAFIRSIFPNKQITEKPVMKLLPDDLDSSDSDDQSLIKHKYTSETSSSNNPTNNLLDFDPNTNNKLSKRKSMKESIKGLIKVKKIAKTDNSLKDSTEKSVKLNLCAYSDSDSDTDHNT